VKVNGRRDAREMGIPMIGGRVWEVELPVEEKERGLFEIEKSTSTCVCFCCCCSPDRCQQPH
jgi:hypothetical protein